MDYTIFDPAKAPSRGMNSSLSSLSLAPGYFNLLQNLKFDGGSLITRNGTVKLSSSIPSSATYMGSFIGFLAGSLVIIAALSISGAVGLYSVNTSTYAYTELTAFSGQYGNTRMSNLNVQFAVIRDKKGNEVLYAGNGTDAPRIYDPVSGLVAIHANVPIPVLANSGDLRMGWNHYLPILSAGIQANTYTAGTTHAVFQDVTGSSAAVFHECKFEQACTTSDYIILDLTNVLGSSQPNLATDQQLILVWSPVTGAYTNQFEPWNVYAVDISDTTGGGVVTNWKTVYDPTSVSLQQAVFVEQLEITKATGGLTWDPNTYAMGMPLSNLTPAQRSGGIKYIRFRNVGGGQAADNFLYLQAVLCGATTLGQSSVTIGYMNSGSRAESQGVTLQTYPDTALTPYTGVGDIGISIQLSQVLWYDPQIDFIAPTAVQMQLGVDTLNVYREDLGELQYSFSASTLFSIYSGSWSTTNANKLMSYSDTVATGAKNTARIAPDGYSQQIPIGQAAIVSGARFFVGGVGTAKNELWISEQNDHTRFRPEVRFFAPGYPDATSPVKNAIPDEQITALGKLGGSIVGIDPIFIFGLKHVYRVDAIDATNLSRLTTVSYQGCPYARTIVEHDGKLMWLDNEGQVRIMQGAYPDSLSLNKIDSYMLDPSAVLTNCSAAFFNEKYYLTGITSNDVDTLFFDFKNGEWGGNKYPIFPFVFQNTFSSIGVKGIWGWDARSGHGGDIYNMEVPGQVDDFGTSIPVVIRTGYVHQGLVNQSNFGRTLVVGSILGDPQTLTVSRSLYGAVPQNFTPINGTMTFGDTGYKLEWAGAERQGATALACQTTFSVNLPATAQFYGLSMEINPAGKRAGSG